MEFPPPRYGSATVADLSASLLGALDVPGAVDVVGLPAARGYVLLVIDGLGWRQLQEQARVAPFLTSLPGRVLDAVHPSTTAANLASIGTGLPPGQHGLTGYTTALPDEARPFNLLTWALGPHRQGVSVLDDVVPEQYQPEPTIWERATAAGVEVTTVVRPEFVGTGLTRAVLRGGRQATETGLEAALRTAVAATRSDARVLVYVHHGALDTAGHGFGPHSPPWRNELHDIDAVLTRLVRDLPEDVVLLVTADHGMLYVGEGSLLDITEEQTLLRGVRVVAGEARARQLFCRPGAAADVARRWQERLDERYRVLLRDEAIADGWFGPTVTDRVRERIGDVVVWSLRSDGAIVNGALDPGRGRMPGMHGSVTRDEVEVPLIVLDEGSRP